MRKLVIFGNGLGRALENDYFQLERALHVAWNDPSILDEIQKTLILRCLPNEVFEPDENSAPRSEIELDRLQRVLAACDEISRHETGAGASWLTVDGRQFPLAIRSYIHRAASYFHAGGHLLPANFVKPLISWIDESRSHIATLNYDELLYRAFVGSKVFNGYSCLLDGFVPNFDPSHLDRRHPTRQSYYLHLHGSPLYYNSIHDDLRKASLNELPNIEGYSSTHLVLTHVHHKAAVISASPILREYWRRLETAMQEADGVVLFGYGGGDLHLNLLISRYFRDKQVEIVERKHAGYEKKEGKNARLNYWCAKLGVKEAFAFWLDNILEHDNWIWTKT
jgi:hypothetical protein